MAEQCRKVRHGTREAAYKAAVTMAARTGTRLAALHTYRCETCRDDNGKRAWHFGHYMGSRARARRRG